MFFMCQGWVIDYLFDMLQLLQHIAAQGMGDVGGMHGAFPPNIPPQLAGLMQVCHPYQPCISVSVDNLHCNQRFPGALSARQPGAC